MDQVRDAMGPDAIIVATHRSERGRGVRVTAALDEPEEDRRLIAEAESPPAAADSKVLRALAWHGALDFVREKQEAICKTPCPSVTAHR